MCVWEKVFNWWRVGNVSVFSIGELFSSCGNVFIPNLLIRLWQASSDDLSNSSSDHSLLTPSSGMRPSHHLCSLVPSILCSSVAIFNRPSHDSSSTSPSCKRSRSPAASVPSPESAMNLEVEIDEYIAYADALRVRGVRGLVEVRVDRVTHPVIADDILEPTQEEGVIEAIESVQRGQGHRIIATGQQSVDMMERIREL
ncbi:hypothetical protein Tco_0899882 [Tanacetum coccineum]